MNLFRSRYINFGGAISTDPVPEARRHTNYLMRLRRPVVVLQRLVRQDTPCKFNRTSPNHPIVQHLR